MFPTHLVARLPSDEQNVVFSDTQGRSRNAASGGAIVSVDIRTIDGDCAERHMTHIAAAVPTRIVIIPALHWHRIENRSRSKLTISPDWRLRGGVLERAKGFEPSTPTLARLCSTPELHPHPCTASPPEPLYAAIRREMQTRIGVSLAQMTSANEDLETRRTTRYGCLPRITTASRREAISHRQGARSSAG